MLLAILKARWLKKTRCRNIVRTFFCSNREENSTRSQYKAIESKVKIYKEY